MSGEIPGSNPKSQAIYSPDPIISTTWLSYIWLPGMVYAIEVNSKSTGAFS